MDYIGKWIEDLEVPTFEEVMATAYDVLCSPYEYEFTVEEVLGIGSQRLDIDFNELQRQFILFQGLIKASAVIKQRHEVQSV